MPTKILVTPYQMAKWQGSTLDRLSEAGFDLIVNDGERYWNNAELAQRAKGAAIIFASSGRYDASTLSECDTLKLIVKFGVGYDNIDLDYCAARGVTVAAARGSNHHAVADYAMGLMLSLATGIARSSSRLAGGEWQATIHHDLHGATLGILGLGRIGTEIARRARGFDMHLLYWDVAQLPDSEASLGATWASLERIAREADFVSINLSRTPETENLISTPFLDAMQPTSFIVNTARGGIVDEPALHAALSTGRIAGAASDVFATEPASDNALLALPNFIGTPHTAALSFGSVRAMSEICATCAIDFARHGTVPADYLVRQPGG